jgi:hypothetical protein
MSQHGERIVGYGDAERVEPGDLADIAADRRRTLDLDAAGHGAARRCHESAGQSLAHTPSGPENSQFHLTHGLVRRRCCGVT